MNAKVVGFGTESSNDYSNSTIRLMMLEIFVGYGINCISENLDENLLPVAGDPFVSFFFSFNPVRVYFQPLNVII